MADTNSSDTNPAYLTGPDILGVSELVFIALVVFDSRSNEPYRAIGTLVQKSTSAVNSDLVQPSSFDIVVRGPKPNILQVKSSGWFSDMEVHES